VLIMKTLLMGIPVSSSRVTDVFTEYGSAGSAPRCSTAWTPRAEVPLAGLARIRAFAAVPSVVGVTGHVSVPGGLRPAGMPQRKRNQHIDLDPQRPRPRGGCD
jgi:hypothetical protein